MKTKILVLKLIPVLGFFIFTFVWFVKHLFTGRLFNEINTWVKIGLSWFVLIIVFMILYGIPGIILDSVNVEFNRDILFVILFVIAGILSNLVAFKVLAKLTGDEVIL